MGVICDSKPPPAETESHHITTKAIVYQESIRGRVGGERGGCREAEKQQSKVNVVVVGAGMRGFS